MFLRRETHSLAQSSENGLRDQAKVEHRTAGGHRIRLSSRFRFWLRHPPPLSVRKGPRGHFLSKSRSGGRRGHVGWPGHTILIKYTAKRLKKTEQVFFFRWFAEKQRDKLRASLISQPDRPWHTSVALYTHEQRQNIESSVSRIAQTTQRQSPTQGAAQRSATAVFGRLLAKPERPRNVVRWQRAQSANFQSALARLSQLPARSSICRVRSSLRRAGDCRSRMGSSGWLAGVIALFFERQFVPRQGGIRCHP